MKRRRRRDRPDIAAAAELGLAWYTREGWERLRELAVYRELLDDSFDAWERGAHAAIAELAAMKTETADRLIQQLLDEAK